MTRRLLLTVFATLAVSNVWAGKPATEEQIRFDVHVVRVRASFYDRLKDDFPLDGKKPFQCDERQVRQLLEAVQGDPASNVLATPRMVTLAGQAATCELGQQQQFLTGVRVVSKQGKPTVESVHTDVPTALRTGLTGTLQNNGKSIEVSVNMTSERIARVDLVPVKVALGEKGDEVTQYVQCPEVARNTLASTVLMQVGRTLVLPGWWEEGETPEVALPLLGKLPLVNGLFAVAPKESQRIIVLVTANKVR